MELKKKNNRIRKIVYKKKKNNHKTEEIKWEDQEETAKQSGIVSGSYVALMLFSGRSGISKTLVLESIVSWLVVETVFPVIR